MCSYRNGVIDLMTSGRTHVPLGSWMSGLYLIGVAFMAWGGWGGWGSDSVVGADGRGGCRGGGVGCCFILRLCDLVCGGVRE